MLELQSIRKTFNRGTPDESVLFDDFSFTVQRGEFVSIVGSNGSGKTTLLNLISGSVSADGGKILLGGEDISSQKEFVRARRIGRVFQDPSRGTANSMTVAENMALAENKGKPYNLTAGLNRKRVEGYRDMLAPLHLGLEERMNVPVGALSGGQRQVLTLGHRRDDAHRSIAFRRAYGGARSQDERDHHASDRQDHIRKETDRADGHAQSALCRAVRYKAVYVRQGARGAR